MKHKLLAAFASAVALTFSASAEWLNGGDLSDWANMSAGTISGTVGGTWDNTGGAQWDSTAEMLEVETDSNALTFTASSEKSIGEGISSATFTSTIQFNAFETNKMPTVDASAKAGVIVVKTGDLTYSYYVLQQKVGQSENEWVEYASLKDDATVSEPVKVTVNISAKDEYTKTVKYTIATGDEETKTVYAESSTIGTASFSGSGYIANESGASGNKFLYAEAVEQTSSITVDSAVTAAGYQIAEVWVKDAEGEYTQLTTTPYAIPYGKYVKVVFSAIDSTKYIDGTNYKEYDDPITADLTVQSSDLDEVGALKKYPFQVIIGGSSAGPYYKTWTDAYAEAVPGDTLLMLDDYMITNATTLTVSKNLTIDFGGYTLSSFYTGTNNEYIFNFSGSGVECSITNGVVLRPESTVRSTGSMIKVSNGAKLTMWAGATLKNVGNETNYNDATSSCVSIRDGSSFTMEGGLIDIDEVYNKTDKLARFAFNCRGTGTATIKGGVVKGPVISVDESTDDSKVQVFEGSTAIFEQNPAYFATNDFRRCAVFKTTVGKDMGETVQEGEYAGYFGVTDAEENELSYDGNGAEGSMDATTFYWNSGSLTVAANGFTAPAGKEFNGWNTAADGSGTSYAAGDSIVIDINNVDDIKLYAQWSDVTYNVTYTLSGVQGGDVVTVSGTLTSYKTSDETKTIETSDITLGGADAAKYAVTSVNPSEIAAGSTGDKEITVTVAYANYAITYVTAGADEGDEVTATGVKSSYTYNDETFSISTSDITLGGADASSYQVASVSPTEIAQGSIGAKEITVTVEKKATGTTFTISWNTNVEALSWELTGGAGGKIAFDMNVGTTTNLVVAGDNPAITVYATAKAGYKLASVSANLTSEQLTATFEATAVTVDPTSGVTPTEDETGENYGIVNSAVSGRTGTALKNMLDWALMGDTPKGSIAKLNALKFDTDGNPSGTAEEIQTAEAFLLNAADDATAVATAKANFKIEGISISGDGTVTITDPSMTVNGTITQQGKEKLSDDWAAKASGHKFFRVILTK